MGAVALRPARMRRALGPTRGRRSAGCGLVPLLPFGLSPAVSAAAALPRSFLPDTVFVLGISDCGRWLCTLLCRNCTVLMTGSRVQCECGSMVRAGLGGAPWSDGSMG